MFERGIELSERAAPVVFMEQVGKAVAETDDGIEFAVDSTIEPSPIGMNDLEDNTVLAAVIKGFGQHFRRPIDGDNIKAGS